MTNNVLIVGASGFVGRNLASYLEKNIKIIRSSRNEKTGYIRFDIINDSIKAILALEKICTQDLTIVLCNKFGPMDKYLENPNYAKRCEVDSVEKLANECAELNIPLVYLSTSYVFPGIKSIYREKTKTNPVSLYGKLKAAAEEKLIEASDKNLILRLDKIIGSSLHEKHLFTEWLDCAKHNKPIRCLENQEFSPTYVEDIAKIVSLGISKKINGIYHCVNNEIWSRFDLATNFANKLMLDIDITSESLVDLGLLENRPLYSNLNSKKIMDELKFEFTPLNLVIEKIKKTKDSIYER